MLKIVVPLGGSSELFSTAGFYYPKPLIEIFGKTMIELVLDNPLKIQRDKSFIFIITEDIVNNFHLDNTLKLLAPGCQIVKLKKDTKGGLCSVLMAIDLINEEDQLLILNGDQVLDVNFDEVINFWSMNNVSSGIITFPSVHPRWSYALIENRNVVCTAEKNPISKNAIAGVYYFEKVSEFLKLAYLVLIKDEHLRGAFFISSVINEYVLDNKKIIPFEISSDQYHSFYSPQALEEYKRIKIE